MMFTAESRREWATQAALVALALVLFSVGNQSGLWDRDEPRYAEASRQVLSGHVFVPMFNYEPRYKKPPGIYWFQAASYTAFGVDEFAARLPSAMFMAFTCLLIYRFARRHTRRRLAGILSAMTFALCAMTAIQARAATTDATMLFFTTAAMMLWIEQMTRDGERARARVADPLAAEMHPREFEAGWGRRWLLFWLLVAISALVKFPVIVAVIGPTVALFAAWNWPEISRVLALPKRHWWRQIGGAAMAGGILLAFWFLPAALSDGKYLEVFFGNEIVARALVEQEGHKGPIFYYLVALLPLFFPWLFVLALTWRHLAGAIPRKLLQYLICWVIGPLLLISFVATKLVHYMLPIFPPLAILAGVALERAIVGEWALGRKMAMRGPLESGVHRTARWAVAGLFAGLGFAAFVLPAVVEIMGLRHLDLPALVVGGLFGVACLLMARAILHRQVRWLAIHGAWGMTAFCTLTPALIAPAFDAYKPGHELAARLRAEFPAAAGDSIAGENLYIFGIYDAAKNSLRAYDESSLSFYTRLFVQDPLPLGALPEKLRGPDRRFVLILRDSPDAVAADGTMASDAPAVRDAIRRTRRIGEGLIGPVFNYNKSRDRWCYLDLRVYEPMQN